MPSKREPTSLIGQNPMDFAWLRELFAYNPNHIIVAWKEDGFLNVRATKLPYNEGGAKERECPYYRIDVSQFMSLIWRMKYDGFQAGTVQPVKASMNFKRMPEGTPLKELAREWPPRMRVL